MAKFTRIAVFPLFLLIFFTVQASAEYTTNKAKFMEEYPNLTLQEFSNSKVGPGDAQKCESPMDTLTNDFCVSPGVILPGISFAAFAPPGIRLSMIGPGGFGGSNPNTALLSLNFGETFAIRFDENNRVNVVGLDVGCVARADFPGCNNRRLEVTVFGFNQGDMIGRFELDASDLFDSFLGITTIEPIRSVEIRPVNPNPNIRVTPGVDAVYFGIAPRNVPTMSEWGLMATVAGLGLIGYIVVRRRKKAFN